MPAPPSTGAPVEFDEAYRQESNLASILSIISVFTFLALLVVVVRFYIRIRIVKGFGADDWTMCGALLGALVSWVITIVQGFHGLGHHQATLSPEQISAIAHGTFWMTILTTACGVALLKISISLSLLRLGVGRFYAIIFVIAYSLMAMMTLFFYCKPMSGYWDRGDASCYSIELFITFGLFNTSCNIFTNIFLAIIPIPVIWQLQLKKKIRIYLVGVLSLGYVAVAVGIVMSVQQINYDPFADNTFGYGVPFYVALEITIGIIAACIPSLRPLLTKMLKLNTTNGGNYASGYSSKLGSKGQNQPGSGSHARSRHREEYGLEQLDSRDDLPATRENNYAGRMQTRTTIAAYGSHDRSGSEESILKGTAGTESKGIVKTTVVEVKQDDDVRHGDRGRALAAGQQVCSASHR